MLRFRDSVLLVFGLREREREEKTNNLQLFSFVFLLVIAKLLLDYCNSSAVGLENCKTFGKIRIVQELNRARA